MHRALAASSVRKLNEFSELQPVIEEHLSAMEQLKPITEMVNKFNKRK